jgi:hypothetical protein
MKNFLTIALFLCFAVSVTASNGVADNEKPQTRLVSGKVIDKLSGEEIAGAEIKIADKTIYTDLNGNFLLSIPVVTISATVSSVAYNQASVTIDPYSYGEVLISLESR